MRTIVVTEFASLDATVDPRLGRRLRVPRSARRWRSATVLRSKADVSGLGESDGGGIQRLCCEVVQ